MKRLSNVDGSFLISETSTAHMHVLGTMVIDAASMPGGYSFDNLKALFAERLHLLPSFRRRVVEVPFGLEQPVWIEDPGFDLDNHIRRVAVPSPGGLHELAELVADYASRPLERDKPLWEALMVEGLEGGRAAVVTKLHHAMMDGGAGAEFLSVLFEVSPEGSELAPPEGAWAPEPIPSALRLLGGALLGQIRRPLRMFQAFGEVASSTIGGLRAGRSSGASEVSLFSAPSTSFNRALTPHRAVAFARCRLGDVKRIARAHDAKVNDVIMAACTSALRGYLLERDELPDEPLVASIPIALQLKGKGAEGGNHISMMLVALPTHLEGPMERLDFIREATLRGKSEHAEAGGHVVQRATDFLTAMATPGMLSALLEMLSASRLADHAPPLWNVVISNMKGPPIPIYCAGARIEAIYPMGPLVDGVGLNITVMSDASNIDLGIMACRELVGDVEQLANRIVKGVDELVATLDAGAAG